jgi:hypothetical protein
MYTIGRFRVEVAAAIGDPAEGRRRLRIPHFFLDSFLDYL